MAWRGGSLRLRQGGRQTSDLGCAHLFKFSERFFDEYTFKCAHASETTPATARAPLGSTDRGDRPSARNRYLVTEIVLQNLCPVAIGMGNVNARIDAPQTVSHAPFSVSASVFPAHRHNDIENEAGNVFTVSMIHHQRS